ncbi:MAG TPA: cupin domain-containing protein, partial [Caulobacteraceae bacterium]
RRWAAPGVRVATVTRGPGKARTYLLSVASGMSVPRHRHEGVELVTVLKGAYSDRGDIHAPGDFAENDEAVDHRPTVTSDEECVCLICADAPLIALDWVGKVFQPLVRI